MPETLTTVAPSPQTSTAPASPPAVSTTSPAPAVTPSAITATPDGSKGSLPSTIVPQTSPGSSKATDVDLSNSKVTMDDFLNLKNGLTPEDKNDKKKADNPEGKTSSDTTADNLDTQAPGEDTGVSQPTSGKKQIQEILNGRDYSGIDPNDISHFKRMSNDAFAYLKPIYTGYKKAQADLAERDEQIKALSQGKEVLPASYYENPEAVVLSPAFKQVHQVYQQAKYEEQHWAQQLENVEVGDKIYDLEVRDGKYVTNPIEITDENRGRLKAAILNAFTTAKSASTDEYNKIQSIVSNFKARNTEITNWVKTQEDKFFPQFKDEKYPGWALAKELQATLPKELQGNLILPLASKMYAIIRMQQDKIAQMTAEAQKKSSIAEDAVKAGPNGGSFTGAQPSKPEITYDMFTKLKESGF